MLRPLFALAVFASLAVAQIRDLATTDDGRVLLFATHLRLAGTAHGAKLKIYRWDGAFSNVTGWDSFPSGFGVPSQVTPVISSDGAVFGYQCNYCGGKYVVNGQTIEARGDVYLSHNGRWGLSRWYGPGQDGFRIELSTGVVSEQIPAVFGVTDSGEVLRAQENRLYLGPPGETGRLVETAPGKILSAAMSADGSRVVYVTQHDGLLDLREGNQVWVSIADFKPNAIRAQLSADGSRLLVVETISSTSRAFWMQRFLPARNDLGVVRDAAATISGDGKVVWLVAPDGRLTRVTLATGERESVGSAIPAAPPAFATAGRGSLVRITGSGFPDGPWQMKIGSQSVPVLDATADHLDFQVPWSWPEVYSLFGYWRSGDALEQVLSLGSYEQFPRFWNDPSVRFAGTYSLATAAHQAYDRLVTPADPAQPGEVIHLYMSGLGPVVPVQADNTPASVPPPVLAGPVNCAFGTTSARVLFAGLAPGMIGVYQVDLEIPNAVSTPVVTCNLAIDGTSGYLPVAP